jgi:hypothetical protein
MRLPIHQPASCRPALGFEKATASINFITKVARRLGLITWPIMIPAFESIDEHSGSGHFILAGTMPSGLWTHTHVACLSEFYFSLKKQFWDNKVYDCRDLEKIGTAMWCVCGLCLKEPNFGRWTDVSYGFIYRFGTVDWCQLWLDISFWDGGLMSVMDWRQIWTDNKVSHELA